MTISENTTAVSALGAAKRVSEAERCAGIRAAFHVYYKTRNGRRRFDAVFSEQAATQQAAFDFVAALVPGAHSFTAVRLDPNVRVNP